MYRIHDKCAICKVVGEEFEQYVDGLGFICSHIDCKAVAAILPRIAKRVYFIEREAKEKAALRNILRRIWK